MVSGWCLSSAVLPEFEECHDSTLEHTGGDPTSAFLDVITGQGDGDGNGDDKGGLIADVRLLDIAGEFELVLMSPQGTAVTLKTALPPFCDSHAQAYPHA